MQHSPQHVPHILRTVAAEASRPDFLADFLEFYKGDSREERRMFIRQWSEIIDILYRAVGNSIDVLRALGLEEDNVTSFSPDFVKDQFDIQRSAMLASGLINSLSASSTMFWDNNDDLMEPLMFFNYDIGQILGSDMFDYTD